MEVKERRGECRDCPGTFPLVEGKFLREGGRLYFLCLPCYQNWKDRIDEEMAAYNARWGLA